MASPNAVFSLGLLALTSASFCKKPLVRPKAARTKKTDVPEHPQVIRHIGLLFNKPPGVCQVAIYPVVRNVDESFSETSPDI